MPIETAIVPVAGLGTRLLPISAGVPKEMLPLGRKPTLHYIAEELGRVGIRKIILVSSLAKQHIARYFQLNKSLEESLRGQGKHDPRDVEQRPGNVNARRWCRRAVHARKHTIRRPRRT